MIYTLRKRISSIRKRGIEKDTDVEESELLG